MTHTNRGSGVLVIGEVLKHSGSRPDVQAEPSEKIQYAVRFAENMAEQIAASLQSRLRGITATTKRTARSLRARKQLDINFSTPEQGLALGISLKSVHLRDYSRKTGKIGRYTHNLKRNEEELRIEASGYHKRQPFAVMIGVLFLPFESCDDAIKDPSSFGSWVRHLRPYAGRIGPEDEIDRFEKLYVALYDPAGEDLRFFDVRSDPPKRGRPTAEGPLLGSDGIPRRTLSYDEFVEATYYTYLHRNSAEFRWADGEEAPLNVDESEEPEEGEQPE